MSSSPRVLSLLAALTLFAAACGGGDTETDAAPAPSGDAAASDSGATDGDADASNEDETDAAADGDATEPDDGSGDAAGASWPHTFVADQIGGGQIDANDLAGRDLVLWFWAPW